MPLKFPVPTVYPITSGKSSIPDILRLIHAAVDAEVPLFQIREKTLSARALYEVVVRAVSVTRDSKTRLIVNDRVDVARAAGADGVQLTARSLPASIVRRVCGPELLIGVSTHSREEAQAARDGGADFVLFGPVFETEAKRAFGPPQGLNKLRDVARALDEFPVLAIGGITLENIPACLSAGARGVAGISLFSHPEIYLKLPNVL
ncbi:MAG TPA: thiamine phosphate synthase [Pyrinomonadaceae bacterium]|nr:thiamine phosphate synthase [Pyrinomonadaceae bacterium]